jgi:hypothetical protein
MKEVSLKIEVTCVFCILSAFDKQTLAIEK